ncbi:hypothetical protein C1646_746293 [Rhizophagus diaphanus]|nr:hypothetical protein C1646_746293 [Rhizophagus diaphanus] [Rhizophagus sp. MUCL 43196]
MTLIPFTISEDDVYVKEGKKRMLEKQGERSNSECKETEHRIRPVAHSGCKGRGKPGSRMSKRKKGKGIGKKQCIFINNWQKISKKSTILLPHSALCNIRYSLYLVYPEKYYRLLSFNITPPPIL